MPEATRSRPPQLLLAFDFGKRRIGVAAGDTMSGTASPLTAILVGADGPPWPAILSLVRKWQPARAIVGLPYNADGTEGSLAADARAFAAQLAQRCGLAIELVDERYSSLEAAARLRQARQSGLRKRRVAKTDVDAAAACVILERWIEENI